MPEIKHRTVPRKTANNPGENIIIGKNSVKAALDSEIGINRLLVVKNSKCDEEIIIKAKERGAIIEYVERSAVEKIINTANITDGGKHQGILAYVAPIRYSTLSEVFALAEQRGELPLLVLLNEVEDPHNLGAIIRSAEAAGAHGVLVPKRRSAAVNATIVKTSAGAIFHIPLVKIGNTVQALRELKKRNVWIYGTDAAGTVDFNIADWQRGACVVVGNEGSGMSRLVKEECDFLVKIPLRGKTNSLNASVAAAVVIFAAVTGRK